LLILATSRLDRARASSCASCSRSWAERGKTVFISSHILSELADLIDWVVIIDVGRIRHCGPPDSALEGSETSVYLVELASDEVDARKFLLEQPAIRETEAGEGALVLRIDEKVERVEDDRAHVSRRHPLSAKSTNARRSRRRLPACTGRKTMAASLNGSTQRSTR